MTPRALYSLLLAKSSAGTKNNPFLTMFISSLGRSALLLIYKGAFLDIHSVFCVSSSSLQCSVQQYLHLLEFKHNRKNVSSSSNNPTLPFFLSNIFDVFSRFLSLDVYVDYIFQSGSYLRRWGRWACC
jgi:hypothetical protein